MTNNLYFSIPLVNRFDRLKNFDFHGYLFGAALCWKYKTDRKYHALILVTGGVGDGKSSFIEGQMALQSKLNDKKFNFENISWSTESFIDKMDKQDNVDCPLWWDEAIQGAGGRNMAMNAIGVKLKNSFVTKRFKRHVYYLALDRLKEFSPTLIEMCDAWVHIDNFCLTRGKFRYYMKKDKIEYAYKLMKEGYTWKSGKLKAIKPDCIGNYMNYQGQFLDPKEYERRKFEETKQMDSQMLVDGEKLYAFKLYCEIGNVTKVASKIGRPRETVRDWINKFENKMAVVKV